MKHTKAPWVARKAVGSEEIFADSVTWMVSGGDLTNKETRTYIAECGAHDESEANAHLIAAAPDLLEACRLLINTGQACFADILKLGHIQLKNGSAYRQAKTKANEVITKAEGGIDNDEN